MSSIERASVESTNSVTDWLKGLRLWPKRSDKPKTGRDGKGNGLTPRIPGKQRREAKRSILD